MNKAFVFICLGAIVVMSLALATYIVLTRFSPQAEVRRMLNAMSQVQTVREDSGFSWLQDGQQRLTTTVYTKGQINLADSGEVEHGTRFRAVRIGSGSNYEDLSGEMRALDQTMYLTYAPPGPNVDGVDFSEKNTWISFEQGEWSRWGELIPGLNAPWVSSKGDWAPEEIGHFRQLLAIADVFIVEYNQLTELIDGQNTRILDGHFDPEAIRAFLRDVVRAREGREPTDAERLVVEKQASTLEKLMLRMWIGVRDHRLYRLQATGGVDIIIELSDFDEPFDVTRPEQTITLANLPVSEAAELKSGRDVMVDDSARLPVLSVEESSDPDKDGLDNILEAFYVTDPKNPDTDGDGANDGDEVRSGRNPRGEGSLFGFGRD